MLAVAVVSGGGAEDEAHESEAKIAAINTKIWTDLAESKGEGRRSIFPP
jgi:hypothetical protein